MTRPEKLPLAALLAVAFLLRLAWGLLQPPVIDERLPDQREYAELAHNLVHGHGFRFFDPRFAQDVRAFRTPGYPAFVAAFGAHLRLVRVAQALLDTSTVLAAYLLARRWLAHAPSLFAAGLVAFNPFLVYFSGLILTETLYTAMLTWGMVLLAWRPNYFWGGLLLALSILVRPSALFLPLLLGYAAVFATRTPGVIESRRIAWLRVPVGATMLLLIAATLFPWALRNRAVVGHWVLLTTNGGITRYDGFHPEATGASDQRFLQSREFAGLKEMTEVQRDRYLAERASEWTRETWARRPAELIELTLKKIARTWSPLPLSDDFGRRTLYVVIALAFSIPFDLLVVLGLWMNRRTSPAALPAWGKVFLIAPAVYFTLIHALTVGSLRYRVPVEPALAVLAAAGAASLLQYAERPSWRR